MTTSPNVWTATKLKTFRAMEGQGFNATLLRNGRPVALVDDEGCGGPLRIQWMDEQARPVAGQEWVMDYSAPTPELRVYKPVTRPMTPEEALLAAAAFRNPATPCEWDASMLMHDDIESLANEVVEQALCAKRLKTKLSKVAVFALPNGKCMQCSMAGRDPEAVFASILKRDPQARILNTMPFDEAVDLALELSI